MPKRRRNLPIPMLRPQPAELFVGRKAELDRLLDVLKPSQALAAAAVAELAPDDRRPELFPDGIVTLSCAEHPNEEFLLAAIAHAFGTSTELNVYFGVIHALLGKRALIILQDVQFLAEDETDETDSDTDSDIDGAKTAETTGGTLDGSAQAGAADAQAEDEYEHTAVDVEDDKENGAEALDELDGLSLFESLDRLADPFDRVLALIQSVSACGVLITTTDKQRSSDIVVELGPLAVPACLDLLDAYTGDLVANEPDALRLVNMLGGFPLALELASYWMAGNDQPAAACIAALQANDSTESLADFPDESAADVAARKSAYAAIRLTYASLSPLARAGFRLASLLAMAPFPATLLGYPLGSDQEGAMRVLAELINSGLLIHVRPLLQLRHALLYDFSASVGADQDAVSDLLPEQLSDLIGAVIGFTHIAVENDAASQFQCLHPHILSVQDALLHAGQWDMVCELAVAAVPYFQLPAYAIECGVLFDTALAAADELGNAETSALVLFTSGMIEVELGHVGSATRDLDAALGHALNNGAPQLIALISAALVRLYSELDNPARARSYAEHCLEAVNQIDDISLQADALRAVAEMIQIDADSTDLPRAVELHEQALALYQQMGDGQSALDTLVNIGGILLRLSDLPRAVELSEQAVALARQLRNRGAEAQALVNLGAAHHQLGDDRRAMRTYEKALDVAKRGKERSVIRHAAWNLALLLEEQGNLRPALKFYELSLTHREEDQVPPESAITAKIADLRAKLT